jgi:enoyl-CoA hydratase
MAFDNLLLERDGATAIVTVNRPRVLNALDAHTFDELQQVIADVAGDDVIRALIVTGAGDRAFVAGADIGELSRLDPASARSVALRGQNVFAQLENLGKPVVAAVGGFALGGGCELAMACTLRIAGEQATFGQPEVQLGLIPGYAGTQRLTRLVGRARALELTLTGRRIPASEALAIGLVHRVVPADCLMEEARALAGTLAAQAPLAVRYILEAITRGAEMPFDEACRLEASLFGLAAASDDMREGTRAFLEKRTPRFTGH